MARTHRYQTTDTTIPASARQFDRRLRRLDQGLSSVHKTTELLTAPMDLQQVLETVVKTLAQALAVDAAGLRLLNERSGQLVLKATYGLSEEYKNKGPVTAGESQLNLRALSGEAIAVYDMQKDRHFRRYHQQVQAEGLVSCLSIGLQYRDKGIGILRLYSKKPRRFSQDDISLAETIAGQSAVAITNARLYREALEGERIARQVRLAGHVQRQLIPKDLPSLPGLDLAGVYVPCHDVGGDFYDYITLPDGQLVLAIGDIMGKGVPASLAMASLRSSLRAYAEHTDRIDHLLEHVNRMFFRDTALGEFATLFCAAVNPDRASITYCNCGHNPPMLLQGGKVTELSAGGMVLGIDENAQFPRSTVSIHRGDMLLMYTDGLVEAANFEGEPFGRQRITQAVRDSADMTAAATAKNVLWLMRKFAGLARRCDDIAVVVLKKTD